jgi:hypothetical protein
MTTQPLFTEGPRIELHVTLDWSKQRITFDWKPYQTDKKLAHGAVWVADGMLRWRITGEGEADNFDSLVTPSAIELALEHVARRLPISKRDIAFFGRRFSPILNKWEKERFAKTRDPWKYLALEVQEMGEQLLRAKSAPRRPVDHPHVSSEIVHLLEKKRATRGKETTRAGSNPTACLECRVRKPEAPNGIWKTAIEKLKGRSACRNQETARATSRGTTRDRGC